MNEVNGPETPKPAQQTQGLRDKMLESKSGSPVAIPWHEFEGLDTRRELLALLRKKKLKLKKVLRVLDYEAQLRELQIELGKFQRWVQQTSQRVAIIFEGRDAAGKGGCIRRFTEHLSPRAIRVVALPKPTVEERGQWYFQRYARQLPNRGEIVFFDRSWYNRAVVEPVNDFCTLGQYDLFMRQVPEFEHLILEDGVQLVKFWFSISKREQRKRFAARRDDPLKQWKTSPVDKRAQDLWDSYTAHKQAMFARTHTSVSPWVLVRANDKKSARLESIRHVLSTFPYEGKVDSGTLLSANPEVVARYQRSANQID